MALKLHGEAQERRLGEGCKFPWQSLGAPLGRRGQRLPCSITSFYTLPHSQFGQAWASLHPPGRNPEESCRGEIGSRLHQIAFSQRRNRARSDRSRALRRVWRNRSCSYVLGYPYAALGFASLARNLTGPFGTLAISRVVGCENCLIRLKFQFSSVSGREQFGHCLDCDERGSLFGNKTKVHRTVRKRLGCSRFHPCIRVRKLSFARRLSIIRRTQQA